MADIRTLVADIYDTIKNKKQIELTVPLRVGSEEKETRTLSFGKLGPRCPRELWYMIHRPLELEQLPPYAQIKFAYGHMIEAMALTLAKEAGHEVTGEQDELWYDGVRGMRDGVVDGYIVDVKSCSSRAFQKFKSGSIVDDDSFGYLDQLDGYMVGSSTDPLVTVKDVGYILAIDKTLGHMVLYEHKLREASIRERIRRYKEIVALEQPPRCECGTRPFGKSGNIQLDTRASYSAAKYTCHPSLRTFLYSDGPVYLTKVVRKPDVIEVDRHGNRVYN